MSNFLLNFSPGLSHDFSTLLSTKSPDLLAPCKGPWPHQTDALPTDQNHTSSYGCGGCWFERDSRNDSCPIPCHDKVTPNWNGIGILKSATFTAVSPNVTLCYSLSHHRGLWYHIARILLHKSQWIRALVELSKRRVLCYSLSSLTVWISGFLGPVLLLLPLPIRMFTCSITTPCEQLICHSFLMWLSNGTNMSPLKTAKMRQWSSIYFFCSSNDTTPMIN